MAAFDHVRDLDDIALKPRLLRSLLKELVPDERRPLQNPSELSSIVSTLKTHNLLSESIPDSADQKHVSIWTSAVDAWVDRILMLARSDLPDKCWAGVCLLGVTCSECSLDRFLASYAEWCNALLPHMQPSGVSEFLKVASCAALSDLLTRLGGVSNLKKDGTSHAGKLVQPILKMLNEDGKEAVQEVAAQLLSVILTYFPSSVHRHYDNVEGAITSKIMCGNFNGSSLKKLACCLASLPKSRGDDESWSLTMQKILLSLSSLLNDALEGLEEESRRGEAVALLVPAGRHPPPSLGGQTMGGGALNNGDRSQQLISTISSLMHCCCMMLTSSYPVQVAVPIRPLLAIIERILMVDGSLPERLQPFTTATQQVFVCSQLPVLHLCVLEVLVAVVKAIRSQLLPHAAYIVQLLMDYSKRCSMPQLRTKVYSIIRVLLISMGCGMALYISQEVIHNGFIDLLFADSGSNGAQSSDQTVEPTLQPLHKKRKHRAATGPLLEEHASFGSEIKASKESPTLVSLKLAAIEALEALLNVGGAFRSGSWHRRIDHLLIEVAASAWGVGWTHDKKHFLRKEPWSTWEDFQLVTLRALLASLLSPSDVRPPYLAQGLEIFRKGKQCTGTKVAEFCAQALLALEVLVHPRALPLIEDKSLPNGNSSYSSWRADGISRTGYGNHDVHDFLNDIYIEDGSGSEFPATGADKDIHLSDEKLIDRNPESPKTNIDGSSSHKKTPKERDEGPIIEANGDRVMLDAHYDDEPMKTSQEPVSRDDALTISPPAKEGLGKAIYDDATDASTSNTGALAATATATATATAKAVVSTAGFSFDVWADSNTMKKPSVTEIDDASDSSFPSIVDCDPDSESDSF